MSKGRRAQNGGGYKSILNVRKNPEKLLVDVIPKQKCWQFHLVDTTPSIETISEGNSIFGLIQNYRIVIFTSTNLLGFVPDRVAEMIFESVEQHNTFSLEGLVLIKEEATALVELCLCE